MTTKEGKLKSSKYYVKYDQVQFEEDMFHEFKGHRNICVEELPWWTQDTKFDKSSRKQASRNLCGFLNTGLGGTVHCGIVDNGQVHGLKLTHYQKDHVIGSMHDVMSRFSPPVSHHRYKVKFVPVLGPTTKEEERTELAKFNSKEAADREERKQSHSFRSPHYCWCDKDMRAQFEHGILVSDYVIELIILPWDYEANPDGSLGSILSLHPIHSNEEGKIFFRRQASLVQYSISEIANLSRFEATSRCHDIVERLKKEIELVEESIKKKTKEGPCFINIMRCTLQ